MLKLAEGKTMDDVRENLKELKDLFFMKFVSEDTIYFVVRTLK